MLKTWVPSLCWEDPWRMEVYPLQYSYLENSMERGAWWATIHEVTSLHTNLLILLGSCRHIKFIYIYIYIFLS